MSYLLGTNQKVSNCYVCAPAAVKHRHCSTQYFYKRCYNLGRTADCFSCLDPDHPPQFKGRIKVMSTSSMLHHVHEAPTFESELMKTTEKLGASFHIDHDAICGGRIDDLRCSWFRQYWNQPLPVDTVVLCGLNDIPHLSADDYMAKLEHWSEMVAAHSAEYGHEIPNTIGFCTPLRAPKYYWHPANRFGPPTGVGYVNHREKMDEIIARIDTLNKKNGVPGMVKLHTEGDRKVEGNWEHMWRQWREFYTKPGQYHEFLHLTDERRVGCYMKVVKYFYYQTEFPKIETAATGETGEITETIVPDPAGAGGPADARPPLEVEEPSSAPVLVPNGEEEVTSGDTGPDIEILYEPDGDQLIERGDTIERVDTRMRELRELDEKLDEALMKINEA